MGDIRDAQFLKGTGLILAAAKAFAVWVIYVKFKINYFSNAPLHDFSVCNVFYTSGHGRLYN